MSDADMFILFLVIFKKKTNAQPDLFSNLSLGKPVSTPLLLVFNKKMSQMKEKNQGAFQNLPTFQPFLNEIIF